MMGGRRAGGEQAYYALQGSDVRLGGLSQRKRVDHCHMKLLLALLVAVPLSAQWVNYQSRDIPRTSTGEPDLSAPVPKSATGKPDLSGTWGPINPPGVGIRRYFPADFQIPFLPAAAAVAAARFQHVGVGDPAMHCLPKSIPYGMTNRIFQLVQSPALTVILYEEFYHYRLVFTDGRSHPKQMDPAWYGYSVGNWEGDDFVVETRGFNDKSWIDITGIPHSESLRTIERFRRRDYGHMDVTITLEDPETFQRPWSFTIPILISPGNNVLEDICENERDLVHVVLDK